MMCHASRIFLAIPKILFPASSDKYTFFATASLGKHFWKAAVCLAMGNNTLVIAVDNSKVSRAKALWECASKRQKSGMCSFQMETSIRERCESVRAVFRTIRSV